MLIETVGGSGLSQRSIVKLEELRLLLSFLFSY